MTEKPLNEHMRELQYILDNVNHWIRFIEAKNALVLTVSAAGVWGVLRTQSSGTSFADIHIGLLLSGIAWILSFLLSLIALLPTSKLSDRTCFSRTAKKSEKNLNILYYGDLSKLCASCFIEEYSWFYHLAVPKYRYIELYADQIIKNSKIALRKQRLNSIAFYCLVCGILPVLCDFIYSLSRC